MGVNPEIQTLDLDSGQSKLRFETKALDSQTLDLAFEINGIDVENLFGFNFWPLNQHPGHELNPNFKIWIHFQNSGVQFHNLMAQIPVGETIWQALVHECHSQVGPSDWKSQRSHSLSWSSGRPIHKCSVWHNFGGRWTSSLRKMQLRFVHCSYHL